MNASSPAVTGARSRWAMPPASCATGPASNQLSHHPSWVKYLDPATERLRSSWDLLRDRSTKRCCPRREAWSAQGWYPHPRDVANHPCATAWGGRTRGPRADSAYRGGRPCNTCDGAADSAPQLDHGYHRNLRRGGSG